MRPKDVDKVAYQTKHRFHQTNNTVYANTEEFVSDLSILLKNAQEAHLSNIVSITNTFVPSYDSSKTIGNVMQQVIVYDSFESYKYLQIDLAKNIDATKANSTTMFTEIFWGDYKEI